MGMKKWVVNSMSGALEFIMWVTFIGTAIAGAVIGYNFLFSTGLAFIGLLLGALVGFIFNVVVFGTISLLLEIRNYLKIISDKIS